MNEMDSESAGTHEAGLGLVEIVVAMFLLALLAVAFAPFLIGAMKTAVQNTAVATGSQLLGQELDLLRATPPYCDRVTAFGAAPAVAVTDDRGTTYQPSRTVQGCPADYPGLVRVTVTITAEGLAAPALRATTMFHVEAATEPSS